VPRPLMWQARQHDGGRAKSQMDWIHIEFMMLSLAIFVGFKRFAPRSPVAFCAGCVYAMWPGLSFPSPLSRFTYCMCVCVCVYCRLYASWSCQHTHTHTRIQPRSVFRLPQLVVCVFVVVVAIVIAVVVAVTSGVRVCLWTLAVNWILPTTTTLAISPNARASSQPGLWLLASLGFLGFSGFLGFGFAACRVSLGFNLR